MQHTLKWPLFRQLLKRMASRSLMVSAYFRRMKLQIPSGSDEFFIVAEDDCNFNFFLGGKEEGERVDSDYARRVAGGKGVKVTVVYTPTSSGDYRVPREVHWRFGSE